MINSAFLAILAYMVLQLAISWYASRKIKSETDYLLAGRHLGLWLTSFSLFATWFGAETVIASSGAIAAEGLSGGRAEPFGYALCLVLFGLLIAYRLRAGNYITAADFYRQRFGLWAEKISVFLVIPTSLIWAAAQILAFAHILAVAANVDLSAALLLGCFLVVVYTTLGGFLGDVITDSVQGAVVILGLLLTAFFVVLNLGGMDQALAQITPEKLNIFSAQESLAMQIDEWMIAIVGSLVAQEAISRMLAARTPDIARNSAYIAAGLYFTVGLIPVFIGLAGASLVLGVAQGDAFLPNIAQHVLPPWAHLLFLGALVSAILSTINSTLLSMGGLIGHNILIKRWPERFPTQQSKVRLQRLLVVLAGIATYFIAGAGESIYSLIEASSSFGSAGLVVCLVFGLWGRMGGPLASVMTLIAGVAATGCLQYIIEFEAAYMTSLALCAAIFVVVGLYERRYTKCS